MYQSEGGDRRQTLFQIVAELEVYERHAEDLAQTWLDMERYATFSRQADQLKNWCASVPELTGPWVSLLIAHADLVFGLWRMGERPVTDCPEVRACLGKHREAVEGLRSRCMRLLKSS